MKIDKPSFVINRVLTLTVIVWYRSVENIEESSMLKLGRITAESHHDPIITSLNQQISSLIIKNMSLNICPILNYV